MRKIYLLLTILFLFISAKEIECPLGSYKIGELNSKYQIDYYLQKGKKNYHQIDQRIIIKEPYTITSSKKTMYNTSSLLSKYHKKDLIWEIETCPIDSITVSEQGDVYFAGIFERSCQFNNITLSIPKHSNSFLFEYLFGKFKMNGYYIGKVDLNGKLIFIKLIGYSVRNYENNIHTIKIQKDSIVLSGNFFKFLHFENKKYESSDKRCFIMKFTLNGELLWSKNVFGICKNLKFDSKNDMILGGKIKMRYYKKGSININGSYSYDTLLMKIKDKRYDWVKIGGSKFGLDEIIDFDIDKYDNIISIGYFIGKSKFDKEILESDSREMFLMKTQSNGDVLFIKNLGYHLIQSNSLILDSFSSILFSTVKGNQIFIQKYDKNGNKIWSDSLNVFKKLEIIENSELLFHNNSLYIITRMNRFKNDINSIGLSDSIILKLKLNLMLGKCEKCEIGTYDNGNNTCIPCPENYYQDETGESSCKKCKEHMKSEVGSSKCNLSCPKGTEPQLDECIECKIGYYSNDGMKCIECPQGSFNNETKSHECFTKKKKRDFRLLFYIIIVIIIILFIYHLFCYIFSFLFVRRSELIELEKRMNEKYESLLMKIEKNK